MTPQVQRVLVADDEVNIRRLIQINLERAGYQVDTAANGAKALVKIKEDRPDLLVLDVMMPEMDGLELLVNLRRDPMLVDLPVILLTAGQEDTKAAYSAGADRCLTKPFNPADLIRLVKHIRT